jgi:hypothetical protein
LWGLNPLVKGIYVLDEKWSYLLVGPSKIDPTGRVKEFAKEFLVKHRCMPLR